MARKLSARERKARKQRSYTRYEYNLTIDALDYLNMMGAGIDYNIVSNPTKASLRKIRNIYKQATKELKKKNWIVPTKREMAKVVREESTQAYRRSRAREQIEAPSTFEPETDYINDLINTITSLQGAERTTDKRKTLEKDTQQLEEAKQRLLDKLQFVRTKVGDVDLANKLAEDDFIAHIEEMKVKYDYEIVDGIDDNFIPVLDSAMNDVLDSY